jgi:hypothetical protein
MKETKVYRADTEDQAINFINHEKEHAGSNGVTITKSGYAMKTKKSKGEIIAECYICTIEYTYDVELWPPM